MMAGFFPSAAAMALALFGFGFAPAAAPSAAFSLAPSNPAAGSPVQFADTSAGSPTSWEWDFGDGQTSTAQSPTHPYAASGTYQVRLKAANAVGQTITSASIIVSEEDTLRLISSHPFEVTLVAEDPRTGNTGTGTAIPQNDLFGYFTIPALVPTSGPLVPEVFVKILDATPIGQDYWIFWGGLTDLTYTLTVREVGSGATKTFHNPVTESPGCLGADTSGFGSPSTVTPAGPTVTPTHTRTPTPTHTRTATLPPGVTPTPTPTATPVPSVILVRLRAVYWQWDFLAGPDPSTTQPYPGINTITLKKGQTYEFHIFNDGPELDPPLPPHSFSGVSSLGLNGAVLETGGAESIQIITPMVTGSFSYLCTFTDCGPGKNQHDAMHGVIKVVP